MKHPVLLFLALPVIFSSISLSAGGNDAGHIARIAVIAAGRGRGGSGDNQNGGFDPRRLIVQRQRNMQDSVLGEGTEAASSNTPIETFTEILDRTFNRHRPEWLQFLVSFINEAYLVDGQTVELDSLMKDKLDKLVSKFFEKIEPQHRIVDDILDYIESKEVLLNYEAIQNLDKGLYAMRPKREKRMTQALSPASAPVPPARSTQLPPPVFSGPPPAPKAPPARLNQPNNPSPPPAPKSKALPKEAPVHAN